MHVPRSLLLTPLLALLALTPSIAATPTPQSSNDVIDPIPTPDFSRCIFPQVVDTTIEGPFGLSLLSDTLPLQEWLVFIGSPSEKDVESLYISRRIRIAQPTFNLTDGFLNTPYSGEGSYPGRFVPSTILSPLEQLVFDGQGDPTYFDAMWTCDATGTPYLELRAGARELLVENLAELAIIYGKESDKVYPGKGFRPPSLLNPRSSILIVNKQENLNGSISESTQPRPPPSAGSKSEFITGPRLPKISCFSQARKFQKLARAEDPFVPLN